MAAAASSHTAGPFDELNSSASAFVASSSGTKQTPYDVFINHCGKDVKYTLASRIYDSLDARGLRVFLDKDELKPGDYFPKAIEEAIKSSSIHIAIFSEHYAQSPWCLAELVCMLETPSKFIPIFYDVDPYILRWAIEGKGKYSEAFSEYVAKNRYPSELQRWKQALQQACCFTGEIIKKENQGYPSELQRWKKALQQASFITGEIIKKEIQGDEHRAVKNVVNRVMKELNKVPLEVAKHPVGLDEAVQDFYDTITTQSVGSTKVVGIWGMGGSGKTTLAKEIFNKRGSAMDWSSFLSDVRDADSKGLLLEKQKTLLKDLGVKDERFDNVDEGKQIIKNRLSRSVSLLIVLDDVDHRDQLDALLPPKESLGDKSLIIVTTRNANVLQQWGISAVYPMRPLNATHAKQLFCWHAFLQNSPPSEIEDLVEEFLNACQGLPLSLKVLGGQLYGRSDKEYWQRTFNKFSQIPHEDIAKRLKVSYDALGKQDKEMFLDAACLFIGLRKSTAIAAWDAEGNWDGLLGWETLFTKCLVEEDEYGHIRMHDHLRDLGRDIANAQSPYRLWSRQQVIEIAPQQEAIRVRGMVNAVGANCYQQQGKIIIHTSQGKRSLAPRSLKIFVGDAEILNPELTRDLIWLECNKFKNKSLSPWLSLKNLRILELYNLKSLEYLWEQDADAPSQLKELVIWGCDKLEKLESLEHLKSLEYLSIRNCPKLDGPLGLAKLTSLKTVELDRCNILEKIENLEHLKSLEELTISDCRKLEALASLPDTGSLKKFVLSSCHQLEKVTGLENIRSLQNLEIYDCPKLDGLPGLAKLTSLKELKIIDCPELRALASLPRTIYLKIFQLEKCHKLEKIEGLENIRSLEKLEIYDCPELNGLPDLAQLTSLKEFDLRWCHKLEKIEDLENIKSLEQFIISDCPELEALPSLPEITSQKEFQLRNCHKLKNINGLENIRSLEKLEICDCSELDGLPCLAELTSLKEFDLSYCRKLKKIGGLENMRSLEKLNISDCSKLDGLSSLAGLTSLKEFELTSCKKLEKIEGLENMRSLKTLIISDCSELEALPSISEISSLKVVNLKRCYKLKKVEGLERLRSLEKLEVHTCWDEPCIVSLEHPQRLESLEVVANDISAVEPFVSNLQEWPWKLMICTRAVCDVGSFKSFFSKLPDVTVHDYSDMVEVDDYRGKGLELKRPANISYDEDVILRCFIIDSDHPDLRFSTELGSIIGDFNTELGKGKWVWMGEYTTYGMPEDYIFGKNSKGEDVKVKVEAAWFVTGEEGSMVEAFRDLFQRWPELQEASIRV